MNYCKRKGSVSIELQKGFKISFFLNKISNPKVQKMIDIISIITHLISTHYRNVLFDTII